MTSNWDRHAARDALKRYNEVEEMRAELARLRHADTAWRTVASSFDLRFDKGNVVFINVDGDGIFVALDAGELAYLQSLTETSDA